MLTGAKKLSIDEVRAEVLPDKKREIVKTINPKSGLWRWWATA